VLEAEGISHVKIVRGDARSAQHEAVRRFTTDRTTRVLLLHAGVAAVR
jgi:hypothetical protein